MAEPTAADLRIKFYEDQKKARMEYYAKVKENLGTFAKGVLDTKSAANAAVNSSPKPQAARVESTTTTTPMSPVRFEAPRGRQPRGTSSVTTSTTDVSASRAPWAPAFFTEGDPAVYKCRFNLGTVNDVAATNWNDAFTLPSDDTIKFVVLTVTSASGKVTGVTISVDASPPAEDDIAKDTPPVSFKILLGAIGKTSAQMIVTDNLTMLATEVFRESKVAPATGAEPFSRWWRWSVQ